MTKIALKPGQYGTKHLRVNGRLVAVDGRITEISPVSTARWEGVAGGAAFCIFGGQDAGGASNEWFVQWDAHGEHTFKVASATAACKIIELA
jgi:hypothetical protein